ncbi:iron chaperone [Guggenheimella bovis]
MKYFDDYVNQVTDEVGRKRLLEVLSFVQETFPDLVGEIKWNQPMFLQEGTFIMGFSLAKNHISIGPEKACLDHFRERIESEGHEAMKMMMKVKHKDPFPYDLLKDMITYNCVEKKDYKSFWR